MKTISSSAACALTGLFFTVCPLWGQSELWGVDGENWTPTSVLPDFSFAGYQGGQTLPQTLTPDVSVRDFGAAGDGKTDATAAFQSALEKAGGKVILIPSGTYVLSDRLKIRTANTVLMGEGRGKTILVFQKGLQEIEPTTATTGDGLETNQWSWSGGLIEIGYSGGTSSDAVAVSEPARRGSNKISVEDPSLLKVGEEYQVTVTDDSENSLITYAYREQTGDISVLRRKDFTLKQPVTAVAIDGAEVTLNRPLRFDVRSEWEPSLAPLTSKTHHIGVSNLTIRFPKKPYRGHWLEDGFNGISLKGMHNWVQNVRIENCDSGVFVKGTYCTIDGLVLASARRPHSSGNTGHHGISVQGGDCLVTNFQIETRFFHDIGVSLGSIGNVFTHGTAEDLSIDHHRDAPYENLFTQLHAGEGSRVFSSGGAKGKGRHTAAGAVFWNIDSKKRFELPDEEFGCPGLVFTALNVGSVRKSRLPEGWHYERGKPGSFEPPNLYEAQRKKRLGPSAAPAEQPRAFHKWTNAQGTVIEAIFLGLSPRGVELKLKNGKTYVYPLSKLDAASRELAKKLGGER